MRSSSGRGCGKVSSVDLQAAAALLWATRLLNGDLKSPWVGPYIPGVHLDLRVYDDCGQSLMAANHIGEVLNVHPDYNCTPGNPPLAGVLGTSLSRTTTTVASLLAETNIAIYGISATLSSLSDTEKYPNYFRTIPSDLTQSKVLVELAQRLGWTYVAGLYSKDNYGIQGFQEFKRLATQSGICVFKEESFSQSDPDLVDKLKTFVRALLNALTQTRQGSLGVILYAQVDIVLEMFKMIEKERSKWFDQDRLEDLYWLSSEGVGTSQAIAEKMEDYQQSKLFSISAATVELQDFQDFFFDLLDNPEQLGPYWESLVRDYLTEEFNCPFTASPTRTCRLRTKIPQYDYVPVALDAMYSLAALLKTAHARKCAGGVGVCQELAQALEEGLLKVAQPEPLNYSLVFDSDRLPAGFRQGRMLVRDQFEDFVTADSPLYFINVAKAGQWDKIGEYRNGSITFESEADLNRVPRSECGRECTVCLIKDRLSYVHYPGDLLILGLYSLREPGSGDSFDCSTKYRSQGATTAAFLAFQRAVVKLSAETGSGSDVAYPKLGALVLDDCYNRLTASWLLVALLSGTVKIKDDSGKEIDMSKVVAVVGSQSSSVTLNALSVLTPLRMPTVSYSATSPDLDDRDDYPYFLRPVPSDSLQARALVDLLLAINVTHVGAMRQDNNYGLRGMQIFVDIAEAEGICVETPSVVGDSTPDSRVTEMLKTIINSKAAVVVVFLTESTAIKVLDRASEEGEKLTFVASEAWGVSPRTVQETRYKAARGALVLTVDSSQEAFSVNVDMEEYLRGLTTPSVTRDPEWLRDFWEKQLTCNLPGGFDNGFPVDCDPNARLSEDAVQGLAADQKVVQTIHSVFSIATALRDTCGNSSECRLTDDAPVFVSAIKTVQLVDEYGRKFRPFLDSGNGNVGFTIHNVQRLGGSEYKYTKVGKYDPSSGLQIDGEILFYSNFGQEETAVESRCDPNARQCDHICGPGRSTTTASPVISTSPVVGGGGKEGLVAAVVVLVLVCLALLALGVVVVVCARRRHAPLKTFFSSRVPRSPSSSTHHYNEPSDSTSRSSRSVIGHQAMSVVSEPQTGFAEGLGYLDVLPPEVDDLSFDDQDNSWQRPTPARGSRQRLYQQRQHDDLLRQLQDRKRMQELWRPPDDQPLAARHLLEQQARPRASSASHAERPKLLSLQRKGARGGNRNASESGSSLSVPEAHIAPRPRALSQDAATGIRTGPVSETDQQLLLRYLASMQAQRQNAALAGRAPQGQEVSRSGQGSPMPVAGQAPRKGRQGTPTGQPGTPSTPDAGTPVQRAPITTSRVAHNLDPDTASPGVASSMQNYGSLLYLHPVATDEQHNVHLSPQTSPNTPPAAAFAFPPGAFVMVPASMFQSPPTSVSQAAPGGPGYPGTPAAKTGREPNSTTVPTGVHRPHADFAPHSSSGPTMGQSLTLGQQDVPNDLSGHGRPPGAQNSRKTAAQKPKTRHAKDGRDPIESIPYIQGYELVPVPPPCGPTRQQDSDLGSGDSNQTSGDSGNGEDITNSSDVNMGSG
nr:hypothetical protein BaRGS_006085 [Batillaria attramentaria]